MILEPAFFEEELLMVIPALMSGVPSSLFGIASYILSAMALYAIARRRGIHNAWLSWVPVANCWIFGSLSDQYQYVVKGEVKSKRKIMLVLNILVTVFTLMVSVLAIVTVVGVFFSVNDSERMRAINGPMLAILGVALPLACVSIAYAVIRFMALFDIYRSLDPHNAVLFLLLSIFVGVTEPFFLFFNRHKDEGMPPRKQPEPSHIPEEPQWQPTEPQSEPWEENEKDYL